ncbi:MAG TPA: [FeFe] hydrogenase, group A [Candidatus Pacearchaeota archaeon]|nr:[FeFe] hydrogenase, group A [Candidatus Pacearchaeota archaeon]
MAEIKIKINGQEYIGKRGQTILEVAKDNSIDIPTLCEHSDLEPKASCRLCLVSISGRKGFFTACSTLVEEGMDIQTDSEEIKALRKKNLELLFAQHIERCNTCVREFNCQFLKLARDYGVNLKKYEDRKTNYPKFNFGPSIYFDSSKCIDCRNCIEICEKQRVGFLELEEHQSFWEVMPSKNFKKDCVYCGQCILHCPAGAFMEIDSVSDVEAALKDKNKYVIFQVAPSIRTALGEEFNLPYGTNILGKLFSALHKIGAYKAFDVSVSADITTIEEANELIERITQKKTLPMFTSCCPAWVKYVEFYAPEFIPNLTTVRSPQIILGGLSKTYFAEIDKIQPQKIVVVSLMPCTAKKYEISRPELNINGLLPIDYVLTTRELARLFKKYNIKLDELEPEAGDAPWSEPTGAGIIYGASGGVTESAMRTAAYKLSGQKIKQIDFKELRGMEHIKEATINLGDIELKVAMVNGLGNAKKLLEILKKEPHKYDYIEVMACYGGCIGGGGQPIPTTEAIRHLRAQGLYDIDLEKSERIADESPAIQKLYQEFLNQEEARHKVCHTAYFTKTKENKFE